MISLDLLCRNLVPPPSTLKTWCWLSAPKLRIASYAISVDLTEIPASTLFVACKGVSKIRAAYDGMSCMSSSVASFQPVKSRIASAWRSRVGLQLQFNATIPPSTQTRRMVSAPYRSTDTQAPLLLGGLNRPNSSPKLSSLLDDLAWAAPLVIIHALSRSTDNDFPWRTAVPRRPFKY